MLAVQAILSNFHFQKKIVFFFQNWKTQNFSHPNFYPKNFLQWAGWNNKAPHKLSALKGKKYTADNPVCLQHWKEVWMTSTAIVFIPPRELQLWALSTNWSHLTGTYFYLDNQPWINVSLGTGTISIATAAAVCFCMVRQEPKGHWNHVSHLRQFSWIFAKFNFLYSIFQFAGNNSAKPNKADNFESKMNNWNQFRKCNHRVLMRRNPFEQRKITFTQHTSKLFEKNTCNSQTKGRSSFLQILMSCFISLAQLIDKHNNVRSRQHVGPLLVSMGIQQHFPTLIRTLP